MANRSPPIPSHMGATTVITACVATAASMALPPRARMAAPAWEASGDSEATMPDVEMVIERACSRSMGRAKRCDACGTIAAASIKINVRQKNLGRIKYDLARLLPAEV